MKDLLIQRILAGTDKFQANALSEMTDEELLVAYSELVPVEGDEADEPDLSTEPSFAAISANAEEDVVDNLAFLDAIGGKDGLIAAIITLQTNAQNNLATAISDLAANSEFTEEELKDFSVEQIQMLRSKVPTAQPTNNYLGIRPSLVSNDDEWEDYEIPEVM